MAVSKKILGMNARNFNYIRVYNNRKAKRYADNKMLTKERMLENSVPTPELIHSFLNHRDVRHFDWSTLPKNGFVIKPSNGYGGEGILAFRTWDGETGKTTSGEELSIHDLEAHIFETLDGMYSMGNLPDTAFIERRITPHPLFRKLTNSGLPDIRVIVLNKVPIMAMMRLSTKDSSGKANLHMGAMGIGIDIRTGITTRGIVKDKRVLFIPGTKIKARGIKIPDWDKVLMTAAHAQVASRLKFAGIDIVFDEDRGPLVLEVNARPGLSIQIANRASLRTRLERIEHMEVPSIERGVEIAKNLFAESALSEVKLVESLHYIEKVTLFGEHKKKSFPAKLDTGAYRTAVDAELIEELGLPVLKRKIKIKSANGIQFRKALKLTFRLGGKKIETIATIADRKHLKYPIIVGRKDLQGFTISIDKKSKQDEENI